MVKKIRLPRVSRRVWLGYGASAIAGASLLLRRTPSLAQILPKTYPLASSSLILDVAKAGEVLVAVGDRGFILRSTDGGQSWAQVASPTQAMLTAIAMSSETTGIAVGHDTTIFRTIDGGQTWTLISEEPDLESPLLDVWFETPEHGLAIGAYGLLMESRDGGLSWEERRVSEDEPHLYAAAKAGDGSIIVVGETGAMFRSADAGESWQAIPSSPYGGTYFGVLALTDGTLLAYGLRGHLFRSSDLGQTWTDIDTGTTASFMGGVQRADGSVYLVGLAGAVLISTDSGQTFTLKTYGEREALAGIAEVGSILIAYGENGVRPLAPEVLA